MVAQSELSGRVLGGKYRLLAPLESGGMGGVWRAEHLALSSPVAVKVVAPDLAKSDDFRARFLREAQAAAALRSTHVVQILDYGLDGDVPYIVMELLSGESLAARLRRSRQLTLKETSHILSQVARAIGKAHDHGITHRDIKPANIFLVDEGDGEVTKVLDFGIAKRSPATPEGSADPKTETGAVIGTPYYMSPEQIDGSGVTDARSDLWALGVVAFECVVGSRPFVGSSMGDIVLNICVRPTPRPSAHAEVSSGFDVWFERAVARVPAERFQSARELARALQVVVEQDGETASVLARRRGAEKPVAELVTATPTRAEGALTPRGEETHRATSRVIDGAAQSHPSTVSRRVVFSASFALAMGLIVVAVLSQKAPETPAIDPSARPPVDTTLSSPASEPGSRPLSAPEPSIEPNPSASPAPSNTAPTMPSARTPLAPRPAPLPSASKKPKVDLGL